MTDTIKLDADFAQDAHGLYQTLRAETPVRQVVLEGDVRAWLVTRYADALALLNDPRLSKDQGRALAQFEPGRARPYEFAVFKNMLGLDPPQHTRLRRLVVGAFTARAIERMRPRIEAIADELLDCIERGDTAAPVDMIANYAGLLPIRAISDLLGMPDHYASRFREACGPLISIVTDAEKAASEADTTAILAEVIDYKRRVRTC